MKMMLLATLSVVCFLTGQCQNIENRSAFYNMAAVEDFSYIVLPVKVEQETELKFLVVKNMVLFEVFPEDKYRERMYTILTKPDTLSFSRPKYESMLKYGTFITNSYCKSFLQREKNFLKSIYLTKNLRMLMHPPQEERV